MTQRKVGYNDFMHWDIIGHAWAVQLLRKHVVNQQVRHAYLFTGPDSIGKRTLALRFAQVLNCQEALEGGGACGDCRACRLTMEGTFPDMNIIEAEASGGIIKVDQIRALQRTLALSPYEAKWRIAMLLRFHEANDSAANALLKTLEEPSPQVVLLLTARAVESLLPTIVSRCEVLNLRPLARDELAKALVNRGETEEQAQLLAEISAGRPGYAIRAIENPTLLEQRQKVLDDIVQLLGQNRADRFAYVERITRAKNLQTLRAYAENALLAWASLWRDVLVSISEARTESQNPDRLEDIQRLASSMNGEQAYKALNATMGSLEAIHSYGNVRLVLESLMLDLPKVLAK